MKESKEKIRARMIRNASRIWGYGDTESEASFDPLVGMLLGALASEVELVSEEIHNTESRIVEKLVQLITPEPITGPHPAHAILKASPVQHVCDLATDYQFYLYKKFKNPADPSKNEEKPVYFTPSCKTRLFNGSVKYLISGTKWYQFSEEGFKDLIGETPRGKGMPLTGFWIAIELHDDIESLDGLRLYFELKNEQYAGTFYQALPYASWKLEGKPISPDTGYGNEVNIPNTSAESYLDREVDVTTKVQHHVNSYYSKHFITLSSGNLKMAQYKNSGVIPEAISAVFERTIIAPPAGNLLWFEVQHSQPIPQDAIEGLHCSMNCFPVINRQLVEFSISSRDTLNIIPLETEDAFFDMKDVSNSSGKTYTMKTFATLADIEKGTYLLRHGGIGRFDSRNAREMISYLLELLRDESAAFAVLGTDMISSNLRELNQSIARLEQRLQDTNIIKGSMSYLILKALPNDEIVFVEFWSTLASMANKIKAGNKLLAYKGSDIMHDSVYLITPTIGGRDRLDTDDRLNAYRRSLLSRGRVVTAEDVKALCFEHFGKVIENVQVKRGVMKGETVNSGFVRTVDITLSLSKRTSPVPEEELEFLIEDLKVKLKDQSPNILPYRVFVT